MTPQNEPAPATPPEAPATSTRTMRSVLRAAGQALIAPLHDPGRSRLDALLEETASSLKRASQRLDRPAALAPDAGAPDDPKQVLERCESRLVEARAARDRRQPFVAHGAINDIRRELVALMTDDERRAEAVVQVAESGKAAGKLNAWRSDAMNGLLLIASGGPPTAPVPAPVSAAANGVPVPSVAVLQALMRNLDAAQQNRQIKLEFIQRQVLWLCLLLGAGIAFIVAHAGTGGLDWISEAPGLPALSRLLPVTVATGFFGGLLSVAYGLTRVEGRTSIQDLRAAFSTTLIRPLIGAAVSIPVVLFLKSGLLAAAAVTPTATLALCFLGGFSERWFVDQVDRITGRG